MSRKTMSMNDELYDYYLRHTLREQPILTKLREETSHLSTAQMQISPEQGQLMAFIAKLIGAKRAIDIGVYTGYSSLAIALALPDDGQVIGCDINIEWTKIAQKYWLLSGQNNKLQLRLAPAVHTLKELLEEEGNNTFDFISIDADKKSYPEYYELSLALLRPGGVIAIDNVFLGGRVADSDQQEESVRIMRQLNETILNDNRVNMSMLPIGDGVTLISKVAA